MKMIEGNGPLKYVPFIEIYVGNTFMDGFKYFVKCGSKTAVCVHPKDKEEDGDIKYFTLTDKVVEVLVFSNFILITEEG